MSETKITHQEGTFTGFKGVELYRQTWIPAKETKAVVVICHGIAEHSGRYDHIARFLCQNGCRVLSYDIRNHGKSGDRSIYVNSYDDLLADADIFVTLARQEAPGKPVFIMGHSMGGTTAALFTITRKPDYLNGLILSAPAVKFGADISPLLIKSAAVLSFLTPHLKTIVLDNKSISRDPAVIKNYDDDPLNYRGGVPARTGAELNKAILRIQANMQLITQPVIIMHGSDDRLADINGSRMLYEHVGSQDKTFKVYEGYYHEIMNEIGKEVVLNDIVGWIEGHIKL